MEARSTDRDSSTAQQARAEVVAIYQPSLGVSGDVHEGRDDPWSAVRAAAPMFRGHDQPRIPGRFGYYDPEDGGLWAAQFAVASEHGISAFSFPYHWCPECGERRRILDALAERPALDVAYMAQWSVTGSSLSWPLQRDMVSTVVGQLTGYFSDDRYLRIDGRPVVLVARWAGVPELEPVFAELAETCERLQLGVPLIATLEDDPLGRPRWSATMVEAPLAASVDVRRLIVDRQREEHSVALRVDAVSYALVKERALARDLMGGRWLRSCLPGWDDTPDRGSQGLVLTGKEPDLFGDWLRQVLEWTYLWNPPNRWLVFVGGWNGWAQGDYLEPDVDLGDSRLRALRDALAATDALASDIVEATQQERSALRDCTRRYLEAASALARTILATRSGENPR